MLLVIDNVINVSSDSVVMVAGARINWFDIGSILAEGPEQRQNREPFAGLWASPERSQYCERFLVTPLHPPTAQQQIPALQRAQTFFGEIDDVYALSWPDSDAKLSFPPMKAGIGATTPMWFNRSPRDFDRFDYVSAIFIWIIPNSPDKITLTKIEPVSYDSVATTDPTPPGMFVAKDSYLVAPNVPHSPDNNPLQPMAVRLSTWIIPESITAKDFAGDMEKNELMILLSNSSNRQAPQPAVLPMPTTQTILLPPNLQSHHRDYLSLSPYEPLRAIPASPIVHFDFLVGNHVVPLFRGSTDYSREEIVYEEKMQQRKVDDGFAKFQIMFASALLALLGAVEWEDPVLGLVMNGLIDIASEEL